MKVLHATDGLPAARAAGRWLERIADPHRVEMAALSIFETVVRSAPDYPEIVLNEVDAIDLEVKALLQKEAHAGQGRYSSSTAHSSTLWPASFGRGNARTRRRRSRAWRA